MVANSRQPARPAVSAATERRDAAVELFSRVDPDIPVALLPVRVETVFEPQDTPVQLKIRIYPDDIHLDGLKRSLTEAEGQAARAFWEAAWLHLAEDTPAGWVDEDQPQVRALFAALNAATSTDELVVYDGVEDVRAAQILHNRPAGGYSHVHELLGILNLSFGTVRRMLDRHGGLPAAWQPRWAALAAMRESEVLAVWQLLPGERKQILEFLGRATPAELDAVPGFGPVVSRALIERRGTLGGFTDLFTVLSVPGMGPDRLGALRDVLAPAPTGGGAAVLPAWRALVVQLGPVRAAVAAEALRPLDPLQPGTAPTFPAPQVGDAGVRTVARLLPDRFHVRGYRGYRRILEARGARIPRTLAVGLDLAGDEPAGDDAMRWMIDYDRAVQVGMAITVDLNGDAAEAVHGIDELVVYGVRSGDAAEDLEALLSAHRHTRGLALLAQGTPTNNTEDDRSAWRPESTDDRYHGLEPSSDAANAERLVRALGLPTTSVLSSVEGADDPEQDEAAAMNRVLWWALLDPTFAVVMKGETGRGLLPEQAHAWVEQFFVDRVRGGGPLPLLRIGRQPYGVLPIASRERSDHTGAHRELVDVLWELRHHWSRAASDVPRLDPDRMDELAASEGSDPDIVADAELVRILAGQPHPTMFQVSGVEDRRRTVDGRIGIQGRYDFLRTVCSWAKEVTYPEWTVSFPVDGSDHPHASLEHQVAWWEDARDRFQADVLAPRSGDARDTAANLVSHALTPILTLLAKHQERVDPARIPVRTKSTRPAGVMGGDDPQIVYALFDQDEPVPFGPDRVVGSADGAPSPADYLGWLVQRCGPTAVAEVDGRGPFADVGAAPLLYQLAARAVARAREADERGFVRLAELRKALQRLASLAEERLDLRFRESMGLLGPRLDAWYTGLAFDRLEAARDRASGGLRVGAFGWVEGLHPDRRGDTSQGFVHAPSLDHAALAGVLRAGWLAHGDEGSTSPVAVDLRSERVRLARTLLEGIRNGASLGAMLGARFERDLRDAGHADLIQDYRDALATIFEADPEPLGPGPIDGERLTESLDRREVAAIAAATGSAALDGVLQRVRGALDAVADAVLAEGVYQLVRGNLTRAGATFEAIAAGDRPPPPLEVADTPRTGPVVRHRVVLLWETDGADPLGSWLAEALGPLDRVGFALQVGDAIAHHHVGELGLDALRLVAVAPEAGTDVSPELAALIAERFGAEALLDPTDPGGLTVALSDHGLLVSAARRLAASARPATEADLADGGSAPERQPAEAPALLPTPAALYDHLALREAHAAEPRVADVWLAQMARVRAKLAAYGDVVMLREALWGAVEPPARVAQWPAIVAADDTPQPWAATHAPDGNRSCLVVLGAPNSGPVAGLVVDEWAERVPAAACTTGVAFHLDSPASRAPQAVLLGICPEGQAWSLDRVEAIVREALDLARIRAVQSSMVEGLGQILPLTFTPDQLEIPEPP